MVYSPKQGSGNKFQQYLLTVLKLSVIGSMGLSVYYHLWGAFFYSILSLGLMFLPSLLKSRAKINLPIEFDVVLAIFMYASVFLGKVGQAYERFWWWDGALHTSAGFIVAFIGFLVLYINIQRGKIQANRLLVGVTIFCFALALGALWEIFEFGLDTLLNGDLQRSSLQDTMWDLIVDSIGALIMARVGIGQIFDNQKGIIHRLTIKFIKENPKLGDVK